MDEINHKVIAVFADSLALEPEEISLKARLFIDLEVSSLDFLDIVFALEHEFDIRIRDEELDLLTRSNVPLDGKDSGDAFSAEAIDVLARWMPEIKNLPDPQKITRTELGNFITVEAVVRLVQRKLEEGRNATATN